MTDLITVRRDGRVALVTLGRPEKRNALDRALLDDLVDGLRELDRDPEVRAIVITGDDRAFAAGADLGSLSEASAIQLYTSGFSESWDDIASIRTPLVAAVAGYALGGGLELALLCDVVIAAENAVLGFPETSIGIIPGAGGTQRVVRAVGKPVAMDMLLTGRRLSADEALGFGLISRVVPLAGLIEEALAVAARIAATAPLAAKMAKHAVLAAEDAPLSVGVAHERALSALIAASSDRAEGMRAFRERDTPEFEGR
jgi:enoyl-CoA hydratase